MATNEATAAGDQEVFGGLIRETSDLLSSYTDEQLLLIDDFLSRTWQLTTTYVGHLSRHDAAAASGT